MKKILVTGGAGFIGSHLCASLSSSGFEVRILDNLSPQIHGEAEKPPSWIKNSGCEFLKGSVTSRDDLRTALENVDAVIHLAAETGTGQSMYEIARYNYVNSQGTALLLDVIGSSDDHNIQRILLASSRAVYGEGAYKCSHCASLDRIYPDSRSNALLSAHQWDPLCPSCNHSLNAIPTRESDQINPASIYAATKYAQEHLVSVTCQALGIGYGLFRLQNVYGEGQSLNNPYTGILSIFSTRIRRGLPLLIFEDGEETRDFIHVEDVANVFRTALSIERSPNCAINVGTGIRTTVREIAATLSHAFGVPPDLIISGQYRLGDIRHNFADVSRLKELMNYETRIQLEDGLTRFVEWVKSQSLPEDKSDKANEELRARKLMV